MKAFATLTITASALILAGCAAPNCLCGKPANPHLSLALGPEWSCQKNPNDTLCKPAEGATDRVVMWSIKPKVAADSLEAFQKRLSEEKTISGTVSSVISQPMSEKIVTINGQSWLDALQFQSEIPNYFTRYLVAVDDENTVFVTFSAQKQAFKKFNEDMQPIIDTLVIRR